MMTLVRHYSGGGSAPIRSVYVDNNGLAREVATAAQVAGELLQSAGVVPVWDGAAMHAFVLDTVRYEADDDLLDQRVRMPWRTLADGVGDCKSTAILLGALAKAAGEVVVLRFIDEVGVGAWTHVYAVINGRPCDPLEPYGSEIAHVAAFDEPI